MKEAEVWFQLLFSLGRTEACLCLQCAGRALVWKCVLHRSASDDKTGKKKKLKSGEGFHDLNSFLNKKRGGSEAQPP